MPPRLGDSANDPRASFLATLSPPDSSLRLSSLVVLKLQWRRPFWNLHFIYVRSRVAEGALMPIGQVVPPASCVVLPFLQHLP